MKVDLQALSPEARTKIKPKKHSVIARPENCSVSVMMSIHKVVPNLHPGIKRLVALSQKRLNNINNESLAAKR